MAVVRVRQHVNPLSEKYQIPVVMPDWSQVYAQPSQPLHLDIGCGKGIFVMQMAELQPDWNFLGMEIRKPVVDQAQQRLAELGLTNLHIMYGNANISLRALMESWGPNHPLQQVSIQFPDPWFKKRHQKRRVLQPSLVNELAEFLPSGGGSFCNRMCRPWPRIWWSAWRSIPNLCSLLPAGWPIAPSRPKPIANASPSPKGCPSTALCLCVSSFKHPNG